MEGEGFYSTSVFYLTKRRKPSRMILIRIKHSRPRAISCRSENLWRRRFARTAFVSAARITLAMAFLSWRTTRSYWKSWNNYTRRAWRGFIRPRMRAWSAQSFSNLFPAVANFAPFIDPQFSSSFWRRGNQTPADVLRSFALQLGARDRLTKSDSCLVGIIRTLEILEPMLQSRISLWAGRQGCAADSRRSGAGRAGAVIGFQQVTILHDSH